MKKLLLSLVIVMLITTVCTCVYALEQPKQYTAQMFSDVDENAWYAEYVQDVYEYGFLSGTADGLMLPDGKVTVAQAITACARIHAAFNGAYDVLEETADGANWYDKYVNYALDNGIISNAQFDDMSRNITRIEMAGLIYDAAGELEVINPDVNIPDVAKGKDGYDKVVALYKAGVLTGNDEYGYFLPELDLKRSELCSIISRVADNIRRQQGDFVDVGNRALDDAYYMIEAMRPTSSTNGLANAFKYDNRFTYYDNSGKASNQISDSSDERFYSLVREFKTENEGLIHLELVLKALRSGDNGVYFAIKNSDDQTVLYMTSDGGRWTVQGTTSGVSSVSIDNMIYKTLVADMYIDLDNNTASVVLDQTAPINVNIINTDIRKLEIGTTKQGVGAFTFSHARMSKNYAINEHFLAKDENAGAKPQGWEITGNFALAKMSAATFTLQDAFSMKSTTYSGIVASAFKATPAPVAGNVRLETAILLPSEVSGAKIALMNGTNEALSLVSNAGSLYCGNTKVHDYAANTWISIRIDADTKTSKAKIIINGKEKATVDFTAASFDGFKAEFSPNKQATMWFDDVDLYTYVDYSDYVPEPVVSESDNYNVGIHVCNLWRDTTANEGWDVLSSFEEFDTYLGYYDEGLEEVADWETKWMVEHGIDFMHVCWYAPSDNVTEPIRTPRNMQALNTGYMNSKYSDMLDFCIMWENSYSLRTNLTNFKKYIWPYWVENYFKDERYARIDNKAVLSVWSYANMLTAFGSKENVAEAISFMDQEIVKLGYDGLLLLSSTNGLPSSATIQEMAEVGIDGVYAYNWHRKGQDAQYQIDSNAQYTSHFANNGLHHIPTVSVGFNDVARNQVRSPMLTAQDFAYVCEDIKDTLDGYNTNTWKDNTLFVSTWNEYSEGTYIAPTASTGFMYLDEIRKAFVPNGTTDHSAAHQLPSQRSIDRVENLYPDNHSIIRRLYIDEPEVIYKGSLGKSNWQNGSNVTSFYQLFGPMTIYSASSTAKDINIKTSSSYTPIDASEVSTIKVRMKIKYSGTALTEDELKALHAKFYFITDSDSAWNEAKTKTITPVEINGDYIDYYFDMSANPNWKGKITTLRFDPIELLGTIYIYIESFELYGGNVGSAYINGEEFVPTFPITKASNGDYELVAEENALAKLRLFCEYDRKAGTLKLHSFTEKTLELTVGSSTAILDGQSVNLGYTFSMFDGLPVLQLKKLCSLLGYTYTEENNRLYIKAATDEEYEILMSSRVEYQWEFSLGGDYQDWKPEGDAILDSVQDGSVVIYSPAGKDPKIAIATDFKAEECTKIEIGVKYDESLASMSPELFFATTAESTYSTDKVFQFSWADATVEDGIAKITITPSTNAKFVDTITNLRFDPFATAGQIEVDYIRCTIVPAEEE